MCKKFRIFVGWEGGVACFEQVYASLTKCHEFESYGEQVLSMLYTIYYIRKYIYTMKHYIVF